MIVCARHWLRRSLLSGICATGMVCGAILQADAQDLPDAMVSDSELSGAVGEDSEGGVGAEPVPTESEVTAYIFADEAARTEDLDKAEALLRRALSLVPAPGLARGRIACLLGVKLYERDLQGNRLLPATIAAADECYRLMPNDPGAQVLAAYAKLEVGQARQGGLLLLSAIKANPQIFAGQDPSAMSRVFRQLNYAREGEVLTELRNRLVRSGYGKDDPIFFGRMAINAMADSVERNANSEAVELLPQVLDPEYGLRLLIDRRFEPIWPIVEEWARGSLQPQRDARLAAARSQFKLDPSVANRRILADALWGSGKRAEATALIEQALGDPKQWDETRFDISMLAVRYANMLFYLGRGPEGLAAAAKVDAANAGGGYPGAANLMPNMASLLIRLGRYQEALDLIEREMPAAGSLEDPAAFGFYAALRFCAYHKLGRTAEAAVQAALLNRRYAANRAAHDIRNSCSVNPQTVRAMWARRMTDPDTRNEALLSWYRFKTGRQALDNGNQPLDAEIGDDKDALDAVFNSFGRELPPSYLPALGMWSEAAPSQSNPAKAP